MPTRSARRCAGNHRATTSCFRIFMASSIWAQSTPCATCTRAPTDITRARSWRRDPGVRRLVAAAAALVRSGGCPPSCDPGIEIAAAGAAAARRCEIGRAGVRPEFPQSHRHGGRVRQERGSTGRFVAAGIRVCRNRDRDAETASRQSAPEAVPAGARPGRDQSHGVQQRRRRCRAAAVGGARASRRHCWRQCRRQQGRHRSRRRLRETDRDFRAGSELFHGQRVLAEYAGPAQPAASHGARRLLAKVIDARERVRQNAGDTPVLLKIAPDLSLAELDDVVHIARSRRVDGMIVANTTLARPSTLREQGRAKEQGGLSGRPLFRLSTRMVAETYVRTEGAFPLIGVGGIDSGGAALTKIRAGASLIQLYSSLIYKGLGLVDDIKSDLASTLLRTGRDSLSEIVGADAATITAEDWPVS